jgi:hypothetical protein
LQIKKAQKQKLRSSIIKEYRKQFNQLHDTLTGKLEEEQMDKIETILDDCEELIN